MKSKILNTVIFLLTLTFSFSQVPTQQWLTVINDSTSTNDLFYWGSINPNNTWYSKYPFILNHTGSKIAVTNNSGSQPTASVLNTSNGSVIFSNTDNINSNSKDLDFDSNDNLYTISSWNETSTGSNFGFVRKLDPSGGLVNNVSITSSCQNNLLTIKSVNDKVFVYNRNKNCSNLNYHSTIAFDSNLNQLWSNSSTDLDWYYPYDSRMIVDNAGNIIAASKKQATQSQVNSYDIVLRKINTNGQTVWQTNYDFNNKMDMLANSNSITVDSNNDIYFVDLNSSNWSPTSTTSRLIKIDGQNGQLIYHQQIYTRTGIFGGCENISISSVGSMIIASSVRKVDCFNSSNGSLIWSQTLTSGNNYIQNISIKNQNIFVTTTNSLIVLDMSGNTLYNLNVTIPGYTVKHLHTISDTLGQLYVVGYRTDNNNINKVFIAKFGCSVSVSAGQDLTVCQGEIVNLSATYTPNSIVSWSGGYQNGQNIIANSTQTLTVNASLNGCSSSDQLTINVVPSQIINAGNDITVCQGDFVTLNATGSNLNWSDSIQNGVSFLPQSTHTYFVSAIGCSNVDSVTVTVNQTPTLTNGPDISICRGNSVNLQGQNYFSQTNLTFNWSNNIQNGTDFYPSVTNTYAVIAISGSCTSSDSVIVTVNYASDTVISATTCSSYILNGETYTESGLYTQILTNVFGCDSIISLKLSILSIPSMPILTQLDGQISTQSQADVSLQWFDCLNNIDIIDANDTIFTPTQTGSFSVIASNACGSVQSDCITINISSIDELTYELNVFPNPTQDFIQIDGLKNVSNFKLFDSNGKLVLSGDVDNKQLIDLSSLNKGTYQLLVNSKTIRIVRI